MPRVVLWFRITAHLFSNAHRSCIEICHKAICVDRKDEVQWCSGAVTGAADTFSSLMGKALGIG